jgi:hypothetical protein
MQAIVTPHTFSLHQEMAKRELLSSRLIEFPYLIQLAIFGGPMGQGPPMDRFIGRGKMFQREMLSRRGQVFHHPIELAMDRRLLQGRLAVLTRLDVLF